MKWGSINRNVLRRFYCCLLPLFLYVILILGKGEPTFRLLVNLFFKLFSRFAQMNEAHDQRSLSGDSDISAFIWWNEEKKKTAHADFFLPWLLAQAMLLETFSIACGII